MATSHWSRSKRISPALAEVMLELLRKAYPGQTHSTEIPDSSGILLETIDTLPGRRKRGWKSRRLKPIDLAANNRLNRTLSIGRRWLIVPPDRIVHTRRHLLRIEAGMGFGSGSHETTQLCLQLMERVPVQGSFLDAGTGSGILAIGAADLGFRSILAIDSDARALRSARRQVSWNPPAARIHWEQVDLTRWKPRRKFQVVSANLLSDLLIPQRDTLLRTLKPGGHLLLSGFLLNERRIVQSHYESAGLHLVRGLKKGKWGALHMISNL